MSASDVLLLVLGSLGYALLVLIGWALCCAAAEAGKR